MESKEAAKSDVTIQSSEEAAKSVITIQSSKEDKIKCIKSIAEDTMNVEYLNELLDKKDGEIIAYNGFEPSGRLTIGQCLICVNNVNKLTKSGCRFKFWIADIFARLNHKLGGDMEKIRNSGKLMIETWKACGMDMSKVEFLWCWDEINKRPAEYWELVMKLSTECTDARVLKCTQIMGRGDKEVQSVSQKLYPIMQCADVIYLNVDICSLGLDQRKCLALSCEFADKLKIKKPVMLMHHMLLGLSGKKMSKSDPDSAIFMDDSEEEVNRKIKKAYCPEKTIDGNPLVEYVKYIILPAREQVSLMIDAHRKGYYVTYKTSEEFEKDYRSGRIHPVDLKYCVADEINNILTPVRKHFESNEDARKLSELVKSYVPKVVEDKKSVFSK